MNRKLGPDAELEVSPEPIPYTARDLAWMEAHPTATHVTAVISSFIGWFICWSVIMVAPVLGALLVGWAGAIVGLVLSLIAIGPLGDRRQTRIVASITLVGGGVAGYVLGGWGVAIVSALVFYVGSAMAMGRRQGRVEADAVYTAWQAAGEPGLSPRRPDEAHAERTKAIIRPVEAFDRAVEPS